MRFATDEAHIAMMGVDGFYVGYDGAIKQITPNGWNNGWFYVNGDPYKAERFFDNFIEAKLQAVTELYERLEEAIEHTESLRTDLYNTEQLIESDIKG